MKSIFGAFAFARRSITWQLVLPVPIVLLICIGVIWYLVPSMVARNALDSAIASATQTVKQFKALRAYYTEKVVNKVTAGGAFKAAIDHSADPKAIPLPATMIQDLSALLAKEDTTVHLYSAFPFRNRKDRKL